MSAVSNTAGFSFESNQAVVATNSEPLEATKKLAVTASDPSEVTKKLAVTATTVMETVKAIVVTAPVENIETTKKVVAQVVMLLLEALHGLAVDAPLPTDTLDPQPNPAFGISIAFVDPTHQMAQTWVVI